MRPREYYQMSQAALDGHNRDIRESLTTTAFGAWLNGAGGKLTFGKFLKEIGLGDTKSKPRTTKEEALAVARSIVERDRARTVQNRRTDSP